MACYNCRSSSVCRVPLSPKWATPGLGSDFAISPWVVVCNHSNTLYLFDPCDSDTDAVVTNPHTSKCTGHNCPANTADPISTAERAVTTVVDSCACGDMSQSHAMWGHVRSRLHVHRCYHTARLPQYTYNPIGHAYHEVAGLIALSVAWMLRDRQYTCGGLGELS